MKVLCLEYIPPVPNGRIAPGPEVGDVDLVINDGYDKDLGRYYCLQRFGWHIGYSQRHFALISEVDETEMERNYKKELV